MSQDVLVCLAETYCNDIGGVCCHPEYMMNLKVRQIVLVALKTMDSTSKLAKFALVLILQLE